LVEYIPKTFSLMLLSYRIMNAQELVEKIIHSNKHIRFAAVCDMDANILAKGNREGVQNVLTLVETDNSVNRAVTSWRSRQEHYPKTGEGQYVLAVYDKLKRITMPVDQKHLIYVSFDTDGGNADVIQSVLNQKPGADTGGLK